MLRPANMLYECLCTATQSRDRVHMGFLADKAVGIVDDHEIEAHMSFLAGQMALQRVFTFWCTIAHCARQALINVIGADFSRMVGCGRNIKRRPAENFAAKVRIAHPARGPSSTRRSYFGGAVSALSRPPRFRYQMRQS